MGLGALVGEEPPPLTIDNARAVGVWSFMDGWNPERLALAVGLYDIHDVDDLVERLMVLRDILKDR
jgi:hypothetical protein